MATMNTLMGRMSYEVTDTTGRRRWVSKARMSVALDEAFSALETSVVASEAHRGDMEASFRDVFALVDKDEARAQELEAEMDEASQGKILVHATDRPRRRSRKRNGRGVDRPGVYDPEDPTGRRLVRHAEFFGDGNEGAAEGAASALTHITALNRAAHLLTAGARIFADEARHVPAALLVFKDGKPVPPQRSLGECTAARLALVDAARALGPLLDRAKEEIWCARARADEAAELQRAWRQHEKQAELREPSPLYAMVREPTSAFVSVPESGSESVTETYDSYAANCHRRLHDLCGRSFLESKIQTFRRLLVSCTANPNYTDASHAAHYARDTLNHFTRDPQFYRMFPRRDAKKPPKMPRLVEIVVKMLATAHAFHDAAHTLLACLDDARHAHLLWLQERMPPQQLADLDLDLDWKPSDRAFVQADFAFIYVAHAAIGQQLPHHVTASLANSGYILLPDGAKAKLSAMDKAERKRLRQKGLVGFFMSLFVSPAKLDLVRHSSGVYFTED